MARELPDGSIIATGLTESHGHSSDDMGLFMKFSASGDSLWSYVYTDSSDWGGSDFFHDFTLTYDGGFILCGQNAHFNSGFGYNQDGWLVKVDGNGCYNSLCEFTGIEKPTQIHVVQITIYPNPSNGKFVVNCKEEIDEVFIYNIFGEKLFSSTSYLSDNNVSGSINVDLSRHPNGIYFIMFKTKEKIITQKLIKQ